MKNLIFTIVASLLTLVCAAQGAEQTPTSIDANSPVISRPAIAGDHAELASANLGSKQASEMMAAYRDRQAMRCDHYIHMKVAGIVLSAVGGALIAGGAAMVAVGENQNNYNYYYSNRYGYYQNGFSPLVSGGVACILFGIAGAAIGVPMAIVNSVRVNRYCHGGDRYLGRSYMELHSLGNGLALNF
jgi:hypothetical protein